MSEKQRIAWDGKYKTQGMLWSRSHDRWFETKDDDRVLDLGCGSGKSSASMNGDVMAADFSMAALKMLRVNAPLASPICCDATKLPFRDSQFDLVRASYIMGHLEGSERSATMAEIKRVLIAGGRLVIEVFSKTDGRYLRKEEMSEDTFESEDGISQAYFDENQVREILSDLKVSSVTEERWMQRIGAGESFERSIIRAIAIK